MSPADRDRWVALGLLLAALAIAYAVLIHPWWTVPMRDVEQRIETLQERELRQRMQLRQAPLVRQRLGEVRMQLGARPGFLPEESAELATVGLVQRLETAVAQASPGNRSCAISNRSPITEPTRDRFARVVVQVRLRCGVPELAAVLHSLESGAPRLFVDNLNVLAQRNFYGPGTDPAGEGGLDVSFDLYGYLRPGAQAAASVTPAVDSDAEADPDAP